MVNDFKVRKWSDTNARPYDVVYLDHTNNNQHYQPGVEFSTEELANIHMEALKRHYTDQSDKFIKDNWPVDGGIE